MPVDSPPILTNSGAVNEVRFAAESCMPLINLTLGKEIVVKLRALI